MALTTTRGGLTELLNGYLTDLLDISVTNPSNGQQLTYQNGIWVNASGASGGGGQPSIQYQNEGSNIGTPGGVSTVNFIGTPVSASVSGSTMTVEVTNAVNSVNSQTGDVKVGNTLSVQFHCNGGSLLTWTDMPLAPTFVLNGNRTPTKVDLSFYTQSRIAITNGNVAGATNARLIARYLTVYNGTAANWLNLGTSEIAATLTVTNNVTVSSWIDIVSAARSDVFLSIIGEGGDGALDPTFGSISIQFR